MTVDRRGISTRVQACVDYCGPDRHRQLWGGGIGYLFGGNAAEMPEVYKQASPMALVNKDAPPFLIVHGTADTNVPLVHATTFYDALKAAGADATLFLIDGGEHNAVLNEALHPVVLEFLDQHLRGKK